jgi:hypothetical protein
MTRTGMTDAMRNATQRALFIDSITVWQCIAYPLVRFRQIQRLISDADSKVLVIKSTTLAAVFSAHLTINSSPSNLPAKKRSKPPIPSEKNEAHKNTN